jgi:hypothetical protein
MKFAGIQLRQRSGFDSSDGAQGKQQRSLKAVACPDGVDDIDRRRLDLNQTRLSMPCLGSLDSTRDNNQARTRCDQRLLPP